MEYIMKYLLIFTIVLSSCQGQEKVSCSANELFDSYQTWLYKTFPMYASAKGYGERHNKFFVNSLTNIEKVNQEQVNFIKKIEAKLKEPSCTSEKINLELLKHNLKENVDEFKFKSHLVRFQSMGGPHTWLPQMHNRIPLKTLQNYKDYLERLAQIPTVFKENIVLSRKGLEENITPPQVTFKDYESSMLKLSKGAPKESPFFKPFLKMPESFSSKDKESLKKEAKRIIKELIQPSYRNLYNFWSKEYYPKLRKTIAASDLPNGKEYYDYRVRKMTTLPISAKEVHEKGLSEVKRILGEMKAIKDQVKFKGSLKNFFEHLRTNPKFYAKTKEELLSKTAVILKTMDGKLPKLFKTLPMLPYGLEPIPNFIAHKSPAAYYLHGDINIGKAGTYQINLSDLKSRPLYNLTALSLHEAVPGHHLQIAISQELKDIPEFRKNSGPTAFIEGWGLYSESLGLDVGMYENPYDNFGRLNYEQWRALRLVVDTGIHAFGWSRDKAIKFMEENSGLSTKNITTEVDRYINWPGQALAYKMGELKIQELKKRAQDMLKEKFDIRDFHDVVLKEGAIPLPLLESNVNDYIAKAKSAQ